MLKYFNSSKLKINLMFMIILIITNEIVHLDDVRLYNIF